LHVILRHTALLLFVAASQIVAAHVAEAADLDRIERECRTRGVTFREVAQTYLRWLADVAGAKPATLRDHGYVLGEPGVRYKRGTGTTAGHVTVALGNRPAAKITTREIEAVLTTVSYTGASPSTVNNYRKVICAAFSYGCDADAPAKERIAPLDHVKADHTGYPADVAFVPSDEEWTDDVLWRSVIGGQATVLLGEDTELLLVPLRRGVIDGVRGRVPVSVAPRTHGHASSYATLSRLGRHPVRQTRALAHA
jgi:hypothetical protein